MAKTNEKVQSSSQIHYPPVVAVLGHVDHGKTTLLDAIRKTNIVDREHGGITQRIGASTVDVVSEGKQKRITFIDTPGHEAFMRMRSHGVAVADIGLLAVASTDGVMVQTKESISLLKEAQIPFICVLTKSDHAHKNPERVKQQLIKEGVMLEGFGGDVPVIEVSAKTNHNIKELLDLILLVFELKRDEKDVSESKEFKAIVIEAKLDPKAGPRATIVVKNGSISLREEVTCDGLIARVRSLINDRNERLEKATVGNSVEVLGFEKVPEVGSIVSKKSSKGSPLTLTDSSKPIGNTRFVNKGSSESTAAPLSNYDYKETVKSSFPGGAHPLEEQPTLFIVLCADAVGSLDAIVNSLPKEVSIVLQKTGEITPADILFAKSIGAIIIGFNIKVKDETSRLAATEKVIFKNYNLIYELLDEIKDVVKRGKLKVEEEIFGKAKVLASFPFEKTKVLGIRVLEGRLARGDKARLFRGEKIIGESTVSSVRMGKEVVSKVEKGKEAGIILAPFLDFNVGDMLIFVP